MYVIKKGHTLQVYMNKNYLGTVNIDFIKEAPVGFSFFHQCDVEFRAIHIAEDEE